MTLETIAPLSDDPLAGLPAVAPDLPGPAGASAYHPPATPRQGTRSQLRREPARPRRSWQPPTRPASARATPRLRVMTFSADAADLDHHVPCAKTACPCRKANGAEGIRRVGLMMHSQPSQTRVTVRGPAVCSVMQAKNALRLSRRWNKASALQHVEDAIDGDRCEALALFCEALDQIVSADRLVAPRNVAEHPLPKRRPLDPKLQASRFRDLTVYVSATRDGSGLG